MTRIRLNTQQAREVAQRLCAEADALDRMTNSLNHAIGSLDTWAWDGRSRARAESRLNRVAPAGRDAAQLLEDLGRKLRHVADTFEREDTTASRNLEGMSWVEWPTTGFNALDPGVVVWGIVGLLLVGISAAIIGVSTKSPYSLDDLGDYVDTTTSGQDLIKQAQKEHLGFKLLPSGKILGDPDGEIIEVSYEKTDPGVGGFQSGNKIVISDDWTQRNLEGKNVQAGILAHEMQHALDMKMGKKARNPYDGIDLYMDDPKKLEDFLSDRIQKRVDSEVRAYERGYAVQDGRDYQDDGVTTADEAKNILYTKGYRAHYEQELNNDHDFSSKYEVSYYVDKSGNVRAKVLPKPQLVDTPIPNQDQIHA